MADEGFFLAHAELHAIQRLLNLTELLVFVSVQAQRDSLFLRTLSLVLLADTLCLGQVMRLRAKPSQRRGSVLQQDLAVPIGLLVLLRRTLFSPAGGPHWLVVVGDTETLNILSRVRIGFGGLVIFWKLRTSGEKLRSGIGGERAMR
jgi:hypothetical protein